MCLLAVEWRRGEWKTKGEEVERTCRRGGGRDGGAGGGRSQKMSSFHVRERQRGVLFSQRFYTIATTKARILRRHCLSTMDQAVPALRHSSVSFHTAHMRLRSVFFVCVSPGFFSDT